MSLSPEIDKIAINDEGAVIYMGTSFVGINLSDIVIHDYSNDAHYTLSNEIQSLDDLLCEPRLLVSKEELDAMLDEVLFAQEVYDEDRVS